MENKDMPPEYQDAIVAESPHSGFGRVLVTKMGGVKDTSGARVLRKVEHTAGREELISAFEAAGGLSPEATQLLKLMKEDPRPSLAFLTAKTKTSPNEVLTAYARGLAFLRKTEAMLEVYEKLPDLVKDIMRHAVDGEEPCPKCEGTGNLEYRKPLSDKTRSVPCKKCEGTGKVIRSSEHKEWAAKTALEMSKLLEKEKGGVSVNVGVNVAPSGGDFMTKVMNASEAILLSPQVVDVTPEKKD